MKTKRLAGGIERKTLEVLEKALRGTAYRVFTKIRVCDVLKPEQDERLSGDEANLLLMGHFDFVVYDRRSLQPVFAVEFDGPYHQEEHQVKRDVNKNRLCMLANLPLFRIGYAELEEHDQITLLEFMIQRFIAWEREHARIESHIESYVASLDPVEFESLTEGRGLDPSIDPGFLFDINHPFPGILKAARRLVSRFGILSSYLPIDFESKLNLGSRPLRCHVMAWKTEYPGHNVLQESCYALFRDDPAIRNRRWVNGSLATSDREVLCEGNVTFSMQWTLPVVKDYNPNESGFEYFQRRRQMPYSFAGLPGVHIPNITEWFSEYLALQEIEKWAETHLPWRSLRMS